MQRNILSLALGASMIGAAALAACSGGVGSSTTPGLSGSSSPALPNTTTTTTTNGSTGLELVLKVPRTSTQTTAAQRAALGSRKPAYVSADANGLQVAVTSGSTTKTVYADISSSSPLCTNSSPTATCTIAVPTVGASENIVATEVDQTPSSENTTTGYGSVFPNNSNVLAVGTTSATTTAGTLTTVTLGLSPVWERTLALTASTMPNAYNDYAAFSQVNAGWDTTDNRMTITAGSQSVYLAAYLEDADGKSYDVDPTPLPFVDVNGSPEPITVTSNLSAVQVAPLKNPAFPTPAPSYGLTASAPNDNYIWFNTCLMYGVQTTAFVPPATATLTLSNNFQATSPFSGSAYATAPPAITITAVPINVTPTSASVHVSSTNGPTTATVTGSDYGATAGMAAAGSVATSTGLLQNPDTNLGKCMDTTSTSTEDASVTSNGSIDTSTWTQSFTVTGLAAGTCTFYLADADTGTVSQLVTVTVDP